MRENLWLRVRVVLAALLVGMLGGGTAVLANSTSPANAAKETMVIDGVLWEHVSAAQNALEQRREKALGAKKDTLYGCPDDYVCLYQWTGFGADRWQSSFYNLAIHDDGCVSLNNPIAYWDNGTQVNNNSGSMIVNASGNYSSGVYITILDWVACNYGGAKSSFPAHMTSLEPNLGNETWAGGITAWHRISSIRIAS